MRHIGILAHSADGAALCFLEMVRESARRLGPHRHPEITLSILPMEETLEAYERNDLAVVRAHLARTVRRLADAGCDFFVCPDNTAHLALELPGERLPLPGLHIAEIVARRAASCGYRQVGLLGTRWTMEGTVYPAAFGRHDIEQRVPTPEDRTLVDRVIFAELTQGRVESASRDAYAAVVADLAAQGAEAVILGCTEIGLLLTEADSPLPLIDSMQAHALAAVDFALADPAYAG